MADSPQPGGIKRSFDDSGSSGADWPSRKGGRPSSGSPGRYVLPSILDGSGRVPTISRKVRACAACKKQKIRCDFEEGESTCVRCKKMKLECVVNRSLQTILDEDVEWKRLMRDDTTQLQRAVEDLLQINGMRPLTAYSYTADSPISSAASTTDRERYPTSERYIDGRYDRGISAAASHLRYPDRYVEKVKMEDNDGHSLVSNPMGSLYEVTNLQGPRTSLRVGQQHPSESDGDFISSGLITQDEAERLFTIFRDSLNHYLFDIALTHSTLEAARASSCLLTAAIFTVSSLHLPQHHHLFPKLCREFLRLVSSSMFDRYHQMDDVRALCIGAFWLTELSWKLSGHAVRIATEMGIHQSFRKALGGSPEHFERARLWYLLYVCDHHFSIAYGRPPVIHDHEPMRKYELYLQSSLAIEGDNRVICQVSLFVIMTRIYNCFEGEAEGEISDESLSQLAGFNEQLDSWHNTWRTRLQTNAFVGDYPAKGVDLHYHFAKLQLNSLSLRGASTATINNLSPLRKEYANIAINSAASVLAAVLDESSIRDSLIGVPLYIDTMIAFAAVFLLKVTARWKGVGFSSLAPAQVWAQVGMVIELLKEKQAGEQHIIHQPFPRSNPHPQKSAPVPRCARIHARRVPPAAAATTPAATATATTATTSSPSG
ncbi:hypothetical protein L873DRAFT_1695690 [Choiromyces venosus 120613-1]|uniref:Zn(2)-C6 fungal-type domain-containing protein n=1 Tax=Choiromyces venosus 120613-1 TaxID=1336337 RepID=A0A3N4JCU2_9PEZI|nr:hypothetical protein L873DRAFT_1695690 [Choiromyces venosus 120613-1]